MSSISDFDATATVLEGKQKIKTILELKSSRDNQIKHQIRQIMSKRVSVVMLKVTIQLSDVV